MKQSDNGFMELLVTADQKELELTAVRDQDFDCSEKGNQIKCTTV